MSFRLRSTMSSIQTQAVQFRKLAKYLNCLPLLQPITNPAIPGFLTPVRCHWRANNRSWLICHPLTIKFRLPISFCQGVNRDSLQSMFRELELLLYVLNNARYRAIRCYTWCCIILCNNELQCGGPQSMLCATVLCRAIVMVYHQARRPMTVAVERFTIRRKYTSRSS